MMSIKTLMKNLRLEITKIVTFLEGVQNFKSEPKKISFMVYTIFIVQGRSFFNFIFNTKTAMRDIANFN